MTNLHFKSVGDGCQLKECYSSNNAKMLKLFEGFSTRKLTGRHIGLKVEVLKR